MKKDVAYVTKGAPATLEKVQPTPAAAAAARGPSTNPARRHDLPAYVIQKCNEKYLINAHFYLCRGNKVGMEIYFYCAAMVAVVEMAVEAAVALRGNRPGWRRRRRDKVVALAAARQWRC